MRRPIRIAVLLSLSVITLLVAGALAVAAGTYREASRQPVLISGAQATADAMKALPNNGAGFTVVTVQLEPTSKHFEFTGPGGQGFGEDQAQECLVVPPLPPLPFITPCRYYPVWVVAVTNQGCDAAIAINAFTGRFGGGGVGSRGSPATGCNLIPGAGESEMTWFQPRWG